MALSDTLVKMSPIKGEYYLIEREKTEELYRNAGYNDEEEQIPNFINIDGKECFFTENFIDQSNLVNEYHLRRSTVDCCNGRSVNSDLRIPSAFLVFTVFLGGY